MAFGKMTRQEVEDADITILTKEEAVEDIVDYLWREYTDDFPDFEQVKELIREGFKGVEDWSKKEIEEYFEGSETEILEWQVID
jgi:5-formaminoimidazole-4-carboxamide-1-beta-D-ribofuranosyl 5'-monophosphate synthetase